MRSSRQSSSFSGDELSAAVKSQLLLLLIAALICLAASCLTGCAHGRRVVLINAHETNAVMRAAEDVRGHVYFFNGEAWERSRNKVLIPEGFFIHALEE